jgi:hypothetical protein
MWQWWLEIREELRELPGGARARWWRAFWQVWPEVPGDYQRATTLAWEAFAREARSKRGLETGPEGGRHRQWRRGRIFWGFLRFGWSVCLEMVRSWGRRQQPVRAAVKGCSPGDDGLPGARERLETVFAEAVAKGWLKPEQRPWAEALARRDWGALQEFLALAARQNHHARAPFGLGGEGIG